MSPQVPSRSLLPCPSTFAPDRLDSSGLPTPLSRDSTMPRITLSMRLTAVLFAAALVALDLHPAAARTAQTPAPAPVEKGQRVFVCGHSFHVFIAGPLGAMAK